MLPINTSAVHSWLYHLLLQDTQIPSFPKNEVPLFLQHSANESIPGSSGDPLHIPANLSSSMWQPIA